LFYFFQAEKTNQFEAAEVPKSDYNK